LTDGVVAPGNYLTIRSKSDCMLSTVLEIDDSGKPWRHHGATPTDNGSISLDGKAGGLPGADGDDAI